MKNFILLTVSIIITTISLIAQDKNLTLEDAVLKQYTSLYPKSLEALQWIPGTDNFSYMENNSLAVRDVKGVKVKTWIKLEELNNSLKLTDDLKSFPGIEWMNSREFLFITNNNYYKFNIEGKTSTLVSKYPEGENVHKTKDASKIVYTKDDNIWFKENDKEIQLTKDGGKGIVYGTAVHRFEFGIMEGIFWSSKENKFAFYRKDETMVTDYPLVDISTKPASLNSIKYPMAGDPSHHVTIGVYDTKTGKTIYLKTGEPKEQYLTNISWGPEEEYIYVAVLNRDQNHLKFNQYDAQSGALVKTLFEEKDKEYVQPLTPMYWLDNKANEFVWTSQRDGYKQLYRYNTDGKLLGQLTSAQANVKTIHGVSENSDQLIYSAYDNNGSETHIYTVNVGTGKATKLTKEPGTHSAKLSDDGNYILDEYSSTTVPGETQIIDLNGKTIQTLLKSKNPLNDYKIGETSLFTIKAADGETDLNCRMIKPYGFNEKKKYPVLVYVYNGPGVQLIANTHNAKASLWMSYFANRGFIVFTVDGRGSSNRGEAFEQSTFRQLGTIEIEDQLMGVEYLKGLPYVDANKMAVHGWSYGGFMTTSLMLRSPNTFRVGVAGGPVIDWKYYEVMYTERYMDTPQTNPEGYKTASLLNYVDQLKGKLLMIHGAVDDVVVWQHSLDFTKKCVDEGVQIDYFMYPGHPHNVRGKDRVHLMNKVLNYIEENL